MSQRYTVKWEIVKRLSTRLTGRRVLMEEEEE